MDSSRKKRYLDKLQIIKERSNFCDIKSMKLLVAENPNIFLTCVVQAKDISQYNRVARGVIVMQMREGDHVASMACFTDSETEEAEEMEETE